MGEKRTVVKDINVEFEGVFSMKGLYKLVDDYFTRLGYDKKEKRLFEAQKKSGKYITMEMEYSRELNDYTKALHKIEYIAEDLKHVDIKKKDKKVRMNKGKITIKTEAKIESETEGKWEGKPIYYFLRNIWHKFVWADMTGTFKKEIKNIHLHAVSEIRAYLNLGKY